MTLTRGHLGRHFQGKRGGFYPARLDVTQDHLLVHLHGRGLFDLGLVFKGGTSLRKMRAGAAGRFSTDLDFCASDSDLRYLLFDEVDQLDVPPFTFSLSERDDGGGRAALTVTGPFGPTPSDTGPTTVLIASKIEISPRRPWLTPQTMPFLTLGVHGSYDLAPFRRCPLGAPRRQSRRSWRDTRALVLHAISTISSGTAVKASWTSL